MLTPKIIERYTRICALADRGGTEGEKATAKKLAATMEEKYPGLSAYKPAMDPPRNAPPPPPSVPRPPFDGFGFQGYPKNPGFSGKPPINPFDTVSEIFKTAQTIYATVQKARKPAVIAESIGVHVKTSTKHKKLRFYFDLDEEVLAKLAELDEHDLIAFANAMGERVSAQVAEVIIDVE